MGIPAVIGCGNATELLANQQLVTVSCAEGEEGIVYEGTLEFFENEIDLCRIPETNLSVMLNIRSPDSAFRYAFLPHKGVGLARKEFIINNFIKVHPLALLHHRQLNDESLSTTIKNLISGFANEEAYFIHQLSYGIAKISAAFYPKKIIVRFSDFKTNEYYNLLGGKYFGTIDENPMLAGGGFQILFGKI